MTFEEFQATRVWADDLEKAINFSFGEPRSGFHYHGDLHIFAPGGGASPAEYELVIANIQEVSTDLDELERQLYAWGKDEGVID